MSDINPFVFIGLGIVVTISSLLNRDMIIFVVAGAGFILWGLYKLLIKKKEVNKQKIVQNRNNNYRNNSPNTSSNFRTNNPQFQQTNNRLNQNNFNNQQRVNVDNNKRPIQNPNLLQYKRCPNCQSSYERSYRFCPYCGYGV